MEKAFLVNVEIRDRNRRSGWPEAESAAELRELARSGRLEVLEEVTVRRSRATAALLIGKGGGEQIHARCHASGAEAVVFGKDLSSAQQRNLEDLLGIKVIDRTQLILDIFARRAHSQEGRVQVELAQLEYLLPRLAGKGILLSRLGGGIGTRGPGEQKLEVDRRRIRVRIGRLRRELQEIQERREIARRKREKEAIPSIAIIGYTNAGKSSLLNVLTRAGAEARDQLFTTLDPLTRRLLLPSHQQILLTDTVGFLRELPHHLVDAFRATLEEVTQSDLLLHVLDASGSLPEERASAVQEVLELLGAEGKPSVLALNKVDLLGPEERRGASRRFPEGVPVSAATGEGLDQLVGRIDSVLANRMEEVLIRVPPGQGAWVTRIYKEGQVLQRHDGEQAVEFKARLPHRLLGQLAKAGLLPNH